MEPQAKYALVGGSVLVLLAMVAARRRLASACRGTDVHRYMIYFIHQSLEGLQANSEVRMRGHPRRQRDELRVLGATAGQCRGRGRARCIGARQEARGRSWSAT